MNGARTKKLKEPFQKNITLIKAVCVILSREFVHFAIYNDTAVKFYKWLQDAGHGDEIFYNSLQYSPKLGVRGAYTTLYK